MFDKIASFFKLDNLKNDKQVDKSQKNFSKDLQKCNSIFLKSFDNTKMNKLNKEEAQKLLEEKQLHLKSLNEKLEKLKNDHYAENKGKRNKAMAITGGVAGLLAILMSGKVVSTVASGVKLLLALLTGAALATSVVWLGAGLAVGGIFLAKGVGDYFIKKSEKNNDKIQELNNEIKQTKAIIENLKTVINAEENISVSA
jgi:hypothetical protein